MRILFLVLKRWGLTVTKIKGLTIIVIIWWEIFARQKFSRFSRSNAQSQKFVPAKISFPISVLAFCDHFNVEVQADFLGKKNCENFFLVCWWFAKIYARENFPLYGMYSSVALTHTHTWLSLKTLCEVVFREEESQIWRERETRKLLNIVCIKHATRGCTTTGQP